MSEGIEFHDIGTIDVTFDDKTYHLGRPKFKQWRYFTRRLDEMITEAQRVLNELRQQVEDATEAHEADPTPETKKERNAAEQALAEFAPTPFYESTADLVAEMFDQIGDPLPPDKDDWPAWLVADSGLPNRILQHWRKAPKASGPTASG